ncbi:OLC1v1017746C1 [Oldenlandia corymbosa var. corymbosa]|uniref:OLC1v1017746C1 n=1 Tax=Oldenlandia corymbosa var. corymbosa TaxID=529605 RepID=A0AAV1EA31_OLDCO|nr:OLC1v1017746C1 [Oldenlandia corymbosa var. corymbosa]
MELSLAAFLLVTLFLLPFVLVHKISYGRNSRLLPPGSSGWPFLGETLDYYFKIQSGGLGQFITSRKTKYSSKIFRTSLMGQPMAVFCDAEGNKFLFSNENKYFKHWWPSTVDKLFPKSNKKPNTEHTKLLRKLLTFVLKRDVLREYISTMDAVMKQHLHTYFNCQELKIDDVAKRYVFKLACTSFLGLHDQWKIEDLEKGIQDIGMGLSSMPLDFPGTALHHAIRTSNLMRAQFEKMVRQRKQELSDHCSFSGKDFISHMLQTVDEDGQFITEADMACLLVGLLQGSYTNVHSTITNTMMYLSENPEIYDSVLREQKQIADQKDPNDCLNAEDLGKMKYSWNVVCEVLRLKPPVHGSFKEAKTDFNYSGYTVPKGWKIHWIAHATHMNPEYFPNPEKFDPSRFQGEGPASYTFMPFGAGAHMCPGNEYARLAILVFLHNVATRFRWEKTIRDEKVLHYPFPRPACGLPVKLYPHDP